LSHSFSKSYFSQKFEKEGIIDCKYELFPISEIKLLRELTAQHLNLKGLNVTFPYKESVIPFLDFLDPLAKRLGAVNVIKFDKGGKLNGYNSDYFGFAATLLGLKPVPAWKGIKALVFGTGGSSKAVIACLEDFGIMYRMVSRTATGSQMSYEQIGPEVLEEIHLLIQCTPLGMHPHPHACISIPYHALTSHHIAIDLVYNPEETMFMRMIQDKGGVAVNGLTMLHNQAEKAWEIWNT